MMYTPEMRKGERKVAEKMRRTHWFKSTLHPKMQRSRTDVAYGAKGAYYPVHLIAVDAFVVVIT